MAESTKANHVMDLDVILVLNYLCFLVENLSLKTGFRPGPEYFLAFLYHKFFSSPF